MHAERARWDEPRRGLPPVGDQGRTETCTAWALVYTARTHLAWRHATERGSTWDSSVPEGQFSPAFSFHLAQTMFRTFGGPLQPHAIATSLAVFGGATHAEMPWTCAWRDAPPLGVREAARARAIPMPARFPFASPAGGRLTYDAHAPLWTALKAYLRAKGPAVFVIEKPERFRREFTDPNDDGFAVDPADDGRTRRGTHTLACVGYDDVRAVRGDVGAFRLVNSWGAGWGHGGYVWMSYAATAALLREAWGLEAGAARPPTDSRT